MKTIVIGGGADELVAAHTLAKRGRQVVVLDPIPVRDEPATAAGWVAPGIVRTLGLERHGLRIERPDPWLSVALPAGGRLELWNDVARSAQAIAKLSERDANAWPGFCRRMGALVGFLEELYAAAPPDPMTRDAGGLLQLAATGWRAKRLGREGLEDFLRLLPMPVADLLDDWFESEALKGALAAGAVRHLQQGPRSGGTALGLLHQAVGSTPGVFRPPASNVTQVLTSLPGIERRTGTQLTRVDVAAGAVQGVTLSSGEALETSLVLCGADPVRALAWIDARWVDPELVRAIGNIRHRGVVARLTLGLDRAPSFQRLVLAPSLDVIERAYDDSKYGRVSSAPVIEARSVGPTPNGRHRVDVDVQYAPYALREGAWDAARANALADDALKRLGEADAALIESIVERTVLSPADLERQALWPQGQAYGAELALDQWLWMRPVPALARYASPVEGLYFCGQSAHPGAGIPGASGHNAAVVAAGHLGNRNG